MFWRFGFSATSTLDALLDKPNVSLEEVFDNDDLFQECKSQNSKLIDFLQQPRILKRILEHVVGTAVVGGIGGKDWEEKVRFKYPYIASEVLSCDIWVIVEACLANPEELLEPFWDAVLTANPMPSQAPIPHHSHPLLSTSPSNSPTVTNHALDRDSASSSPADEGTGKLRSIRALDNGPGRSVLAGYWAKVNGVFLDRKPREMLSFIRGLPRIVERFVAHLETPAVVDLLYRIIQCEESVPAIGVIDWLSGRDLVPRLVELLSPTHSPDMHNTVSELLKAIIALSAPSPATLNQAQGQPDGYGGFTSSDSGPSLGGINNRLVRELAVESNVRRMVTFMLDAAMPSQLSRRLTDAAADLDEVSLRDTDPSKGAVGQKIPQSTLLLGRGVDAHARGGDSAIDDDDDEEVTPQPLNPRDTPASESPAVYDDKKDARRASELPAVQAPQVAVSAETCTSSLVTCIGIFIELIRKNNSDYFEQHLFHTLRTYLLQRQQEIAEGRAASSRARESTADSAATTIGPSGGPDSAEGGSSKAEDDEEMEGMEEAMAELSDKLGIVHLGPMLRVLCSRLQDFQELLQHPRNADATMVTTLGTIQPLTFERYRIAELYAELLHCSNMALLNRAPGDGPQYAEDGTLLGGINGLQTLARTLQGSEGEVGDSSVAGTEVPTDAGDETVAESDAGSVAAQATAPSGESGDVDPSVAEEEDNGLKTSSSSAEPTVRSHSRDASTRHTRQHSSSGGDSSFDSSTGDDSLEIALDATRSLGESTFVDAISLDTDATSIDKREGPEVERKSVLSNLSNLSLDQPASPQSAKPPSLADEAVEGDGSDVVVGDLLKQRFLQCGIIPSILTLFFECPWNNFLHNVVYDILQQFFNGRMDVGLNRKLTVAVFTSGKLATKIVEGHQRNEESMSGPRRIRMGYMGHMNLIAEEVVKLLERYPTEIAQVVSDAMDQPAWDDFVNTSLRENREREAAPLAGGRPSMTTTIATNQAGGLDDDDEQLGMVSGGNDAFANYLSSQIGRGGSSDDDDSDEDTSWLSQGISVTRGGDGFDDAFEPGSNGGSNSMSNSTDDDDWGPFADSGEAAFDWPGTGPEATTTASTSAFSQNLTPADWAAAFRREGTPEPPAPGSDVDDSNSTASTEETATTPTRETSESPFVDLLDPASVLRTDAVASNHARRPSLTQTEAPVIVSPKSAGSGSDGGSGLGSSDLSSAQAAHEDAPLGPGINASDTVATQEGMLRRRMSDGTEVVVPLDEVALTTTAANESAVE